MNFEISQNLVGKRVVILTVKGKVEGDVHNVDPNGSKIYLVNAVMVENGAKLPMQYRIFAKDIEGITMADGSDTNSEEGVNSSRKTKLSPPASLQIQSQSPVRTKTGQSPSGNGRTLNSPSSSYERRTQPLVLRKNTPSHLKSLDNNVRTDVLTNQVPNTTNGKEICPPTFSNYIIIEQIDSLYFKMIDQLKRETSIGLSMEGVRIGRFGVICWIGIATNEHVFLLDMCSLGPAGVEAGIAEILTNKNILKITHDCRFMSDALFHQYDLKLENVFDTQVAASVVDLKKNGVFNRFVPSLTRCLNEYLNLPLESMFHPRVRVGHEKEDESIWKQRPLPQHLIDGATFNVFHLKNLRLALMEKLLAEVNIGTSLYLKDVSMMEDEMVAEKGAASHLIPISFKQLTSQRNKSDEEEFQSVIPSNGCDPYISFTRHITHVRRSNNFN